MTTSPDFSFQVLSATHDPTINPVSISFKLSLHSQDDGQETGESEFSKADLLNISFKHTKSMPEEVIEHINNNLGSYDLSEDKATNMKTMTFELKINDIDSQKIMDVFEDFFAKKSKNSCFEVNYQRSQQMEQFTQELKEFSQVPVLLHLIEHSKLTINATDFNPLIDSFVQFLKSQSQLELAKVVRVCMLLKRFNGNLKFVSYKDGLDKDFQEAFLDQRDLFKEFFLAFENPLMRYIFENDQEGYLVIQGRILNILKYEVIVNAKNLCEFLYKIKTS